MRYVSSGAKGRRTFAIRFEPGEKLVEGLKQAAKELSVRGAWLSGLGSVKDVELGWFDTQTRAYVTNTLPGPLELLSVSGNIGMAEGEPVVHAHVTCSGNDIVALGGHLVEASCAVTVEFEVREAGMPLDRALDPATGLKLLDL